MVIKNEALGISEKDVETETDVSTLNKWRASIDREIININQSISNKERGGRLTNADKLWLAKAVAYRSLQCQLKVEVDLRLSQLKRGGNLEQQRVEKEFWKSKLKMVAPTLFEEFTKELENL